MCHSGCPPEHGRISHENAQCPSFRNSIVTAWLSSQATNTAAMFSVPFRFPMMFLVRSTARSRAVLSTSPTGNDCCQDWPSLWPLAEKVFARLTQGQKVFQVLTADVARGISLTCSNILQGTTKHHPHAKRSACGWCPLKKILSNV